MQSRIFPLSWNTIRCSLRLVHVHLALKLRFRSQMQPLLGPDTSGTAGGTRSPGARCVTLCAQTTESESKSPTSLNSELSHTGEMMYPPYLPMPAFATLSLVLYS